MRHKSNISPRRSITKIICVKTGRIQIPKSDGSIVERTGTACPLELFETYTTTGLVVHDNGDLCYPINEHGGTEMLAQRFVVYNGSRKPSSKPSKRSL